MMMRQTKMLAIVVIVLLAGILALMLPDRRGEDADAGSLLPDLKADINRISQVSVSKAAESLTLSNETGKWVLVERQNYPADTGKLRQLLLALADATKLERKTSNPEMYERLGVEDSGADSESTEIRISGPGLEFALILGDTAQSRYRYARIPGQAESWLIDQNPVLPGSAGGWLLQEILDIDSSRVRSVTITHGGAETIRIEKKDKDAAGFEVPDIPDGRELSYPGVVNGIAGVLSKLNLQDVAVSSASGAGDAKTVFTTFDGLEVSVDSWLRDENTWITVGARQLPIAPPPEPDDQGSSEQQPETGDPAVPGPDEAEIINRRVHGWEYQVQSYKGDQLRRRWDDILNTAE